MPIVAFKCFKFTNASLSDIKIKSLEKQKGRCKNLYQIKASPCPQGNSPARPGFSPGCLFLSCIFSIKFGTLDSVFPWSERTALPLSAEWYIPRGMLAISSFTSDAANSSKAEVGGGGGEEVKRQWGERNKTKGDWLEKTRTTQPKQNHHDYLGMLYWNKW